MSEGNDPNTQQASLVPDRFTSTTPQLLMISSHEHVLAREGGLLVLHHRKRGCAIVESRP